VSRPAITRADFQQLADVRLAEAKALLDLGMWDGAFYLAGYAVEVALKACIIEKMMATDAFPDKQFSAACYSHKLDDLLKLAGLLPAQFAMEAADQLFSDYWAVARDWSEQSRYHRITEAEARGLYTSISDAQHGVLPWIRTHW
jgi:hypothetical protein